MEEMFQVRAGLEDWFPLLIIFSVIVTQILKASRAAKPRPPSEGGGGRERPPRPVSDASEELREFIEQLSGGKAPPSKPAPPPVLASARPAARPAAAQRPARRTATRPPPVPAAPRVAPPRPAAPRPSAVPPSGLGKPIGTRRQAPRRRPRADIAPRLDEIVGRLDDRRALARAMVLREVLGPPLGLRTPER